jgi:hypothetical protein
VAGGERRVLIEILAICGVLAGPAHPGLDGGWIRESDRTLPPAAKLDWQYPAAWWRGGMVDPSTVQYWFPELGTVLASTP